MPAARPVICVETGVTYRNLTDAAESIGMAVSGLHKAVSKGGTCGGYHWKYRNPTTREIYKNLKFSESQDSV
eukprot:g48525.t1